LVNINLNEDLVQNNIAGILEGLANQSEHIIQEGQGGQSSMPANLNAGMVLPESIECDPGLEAHYANKEMLGNTTKGQEN
jgi:hypothetical protein